MTKQIIERRQKAEVLRLLASNPAVGIYGPRQSGKTTLAEAIMAETEGAVRLDCQHWETIAMLDERGLRPYVRSHPGKLIVLDEIQRRANLFSELRGLIDERKSGGMRTGCFLLLWSSRSANQQDESLAGRLSRISLDPLDVLEIASDEPGELERLWLRGGLPDSFLAEDEASSLQMRRDLIASIIDMDIGEGRQRARPGKMHSLCAFLAHSQGDPFNVSQIAMRLGQTDKRFVSRGVERLCDLMVARRLHPHSGNLKKRMVKTPRFYYRDSGLLHQLLGITSADMLEHHPMAGPSWEGFAIENILRQVPQEVEDQATFYRTSNGAEIDLILEHPDGTSWAFEIKKGLEPVVSKGFYSVLKDLGKARGFVVHRGELHYKDEEGTEFTPLPDICRKVAKHFGR